MGSERGEWGLPTGRHLLLEAGDLMVNSTTETTGSTTMPLYDLELT